MREPDLSLSTVTDLLAMNKPEEALAILNQLSDEGDGEIIFMKGEIYFKLQKWGEALNQFLLFLELYPSDQKAKSYCTMIQNILGFYHKDLYNP